MNNTVKNNGLAKKVLNGAKNLMVKNKKFEIKHQDKVSAHEYFSNKSLLDNHEFTKVKLSDYGYEQAGLNKGDETALTNFLNAIKEGHIVDVTFSESDHLKRKSAVEEIMNEKSKQIIDNQLTNKNINNVLIPDKHSIIKEKENELKKIEADRIKGRLNADFKQSRYIIYNVLTWVLGFYLILFYASAIHSTFFRNLLQDLSEYGNSENLSIILNSIFDPMALFTFKTSTIFIYTGSALFFSIGLLAHSFFHRQKNLKNKIIVGMASFGLPLIADVFIAHKIHSNIVQAKSLIGIEDNTPWYLSDNFWLVIIFGYIAYMAWALLFEECNREADKKSNDKVAEMMTKNIKNDIRELRNAIKELQLQNNNTLAVIQKLQQEVEVLKKQIEKIIQEPDLLLRNLHNFYEGWLRYINNAGSLSHRKKLCDDTFNKFLSENFTINNN